MVSEKVKALLNLTGKKQSDLAAHMGIAAQSVANKMLRDSWNASDLVKVAKFTGAKVGFILPDGTSIYLDAAEETEKGSDD